jgi:D-threonine aldolase
MKNEQHTWYTITNIETVDSPALLLYKDRVLENIRQLKNSVKDIGTLRPHIKTNKTAEVCRMMMEEGISKFKCATIAEAEMLGSIGAGDVLLAYQPVGPKMFRLLEVSEKFPRTHFSTVVDSQKIAEELSALFHFHGRTLPIYIDINAGMNRTGILPDHVYALFESIQKLPGLTLSGLHAYDGHINDSDYSVRKKRTDDAFENVSALRMKIEEKLHRKIAVVAGGSPTFPVHAQRDGVECSPGTFVFWDWNYKEAFPDEPFDYAALVVTRVISIVDSKTLCTDLGHKSIAAERPLPRVHFLNAPGAVPVSQSEEHLVVNVADASAYAVGDVLYGVPVHVCPTVALYERASVVEHNTVVGQWRVIARDKKITI